jgi:predicted ArsR family transcriptional regulator
MDVPRRPGDVLAQPTRASLFALLTQLRRPTGTEELAERLDLHPNGVRVHLERLLDAGLLLREHERQPRGRPRDVWSVRPDAQPGGEPPTAYADLGRWLVRALVESKARVRGIEGTGRRIGRELTADGANGAREERFHAVLAAMGFRPHRELTPQGTLTYRLDNCPYRDAVRERQQLVCALHRGLTRGMLDNIDPKTKLAGFVPRDPYAAGCLIQLRGPLAGEAAARQTAEL